MNRIKFLIIGLIAISNTVFSQTKNFIDLPYIETSAKVDTLVMPDRVYLTIILTEKDTKGKISVEELEEKMINRLTSIGIEMPPRTAPRRGATGWLPRRRLYPYGVRIGGWIFTTRGVHPRLPRYDHDAVGENEKVIY
jgi:hypothetical protein